MFKLVLILFAFCIIVAGMKSTPSVKELTKVTKIYCKDICK